MSDLTFVMVIKNRDRVRAERCIDSLLNQTYPVDIIVVDYGSDDTSWYSDVFGKVNLIYVKRDTTIFNKSRALNIGFKHTKTKYVVSTDIDIIFASNFAEEIMDVFNANNKAIVLCQKIDLDQNGNEEDVHEPSASGSCIAIDREWIYKVHGYDEFYTYWGREDNDLVDRAKEDGYEVVWVTDKTKMWHQWHKPATNSTLDKNDLYYRQSGKRIVRNASSWGDL
jgi:glycosyltransferase involved in cell wall biosynthesis